MGEGGVGEVGGWEDGRYCVIRERFLLVWVRLAFDGWVFLEFILIKDTISPFLLLHGFAIALEYTLVNQ